MGTSDTDPAITVSPDACATREHCEERMGAIEERLALVEPVVARVPAVESRIHRIERLMMELQGGIRRIEKATDEHQRRIEAKLEDIVRLLKPVPANGTSP